MPGHKLHPSYGNLSFDDDTCFLCGRSDEKLTLEHVFPKWLLRYFNLYNSKLTLLNRTLLPYRLLTIPCCPECNGKHLSALEDRVRNAVVEDKKLDSLTDLDLYLWLGKIFFGILRKEIILKFNRSDPDSDPIFTKELLQSYENLHRFLQIIRGKYEIRDNGPFSVLRANLTKINDNRHFDFYDDFVSFVAGMRLDNQGVIVAFQDIGLSSDTYGKYLCEVGSRRLHPLQFEEVYAKVSYQLSLMEFTPSFITSTHVEGKEVGVINTIVPLSLSSPLPMSPWDQGEFAKRFYHHANRWMKMPIPFESFYHPPDLVRTWMTDENGNLLLLTEEEWNQPPNNAVN